MVRLKNRYIVAEFDYFDNKEVVVTKNMLSDIIKEQIADLHGDHGVGLIEFGFFIKYLNPLTRIVIIRMRHRTYKYATSSIPFIRNPIRFRILRITATILHAFKFIRTYQIKELERMWKDRHKKLSMLEAKKLAGLQKDDFLSTIEY